MSAFARQADFRANLDVLASIAEFVEDVCVEVGIEADARFDIQLAVEEACCNVIEHACAGLDCNLTLRLATDDGDLIVTVQDRGRPFDPDAVPMPDLQAPLDERPIGGLGLHLMRQLMDEVRFSFSATEGNTLAMVKRDVVPKPQPPTPQR